MAALPSRHICIVGALSVAVGVASIVDMILAAIEGRIAFDLGFIGIPIGYGILIGSATARKWAMFFSGAGMLLTTGAGCWIAYAHFSGTKHLPYPDSAYAALMIATTVAACAYAFFVLHRPLNRQWFESAVEDKTDAKSVVWAVVVLSSLMSIGIHAKAAIMEAKFSRIYSVDVSILPFNAETGKRLDSFSCGRDYTTENANPMAKKLPGLSTSIIGEKEGPRMRLSGIGLNPTKITIDADGFEETTVTIDKDSPPEIRLPMRSEKNGEREAD